MVIKWRCPVHRDISLALSEQSFRCQLGCSFPVTQGILRALREPNYSQAFGVQWNEWRVTQLDSHTATTISRDRLRSALGDEAFDTLRGRRVLEVGCGAGRFTEVLLEQGATVVSVDISSAIDANALNFPPSNQHVLIQADLTRLPLEPHQFHIVLALGVIQHTPRPRESLRVLYEMVAPGGMLVFDQYAAGLSHIFQLKVLYRQVAKRMSPDRAMKFVDSLYARWAPRHQRVRSKFGRILLSRISPVVCFTTEFPQLSPEDRDAWGRLDTFDSLTDWYKHRTTAAQLTRTLRKLGISDFLVQRGTNGWIASVRRQRGA